jgi:hypothetical protein
MRVVFSVLFSSLLLSACANPEQQTQAQRNSQCAMAGGEACNKYYKFPGKTQAQVNQIRLDCAKQADAANGTEAIYADTHERCVIANGGAM